MLCAVLFLISLAVMMKMPQPVSGLGLHDPIFIQGDADFIGTNGVTGGDGSPSNPYVIEGWSIDASSSNGIEIRDTTASFIVRNVSVLDGTWNHNCVLISNSTNVVIEDVTVVSGGNGLRLENCPSAFVRNISASDCWNGIQLLMSDFCILAENHFQNNWMGVEIDSALNATFFSNSFNNDGISVVGDYLREETYNSHTIPANNTVNGRPVLYYKFQSGLTIDALDVGQLMIVNCTDVTISNMTISNTSEGIFIALCEEVSITGSTLENSSHGLTCIECVNVTAVNNTGCHNWGVNLDFVRCRNVLVHDNNLSDGDYVGVELYNCWNAKVSSNMISNMSLMYGLMVNSEDVNLTAYQLSMCGIGGYFRAGMNVSIWPDNTVNGNPVLYYTGLDGLVVDSKPLGQLLIFDCVDVRVANISVSQTYAGIAAEYVTNLTVLNTSLTGNSMGMSISDCSNCVLAQNLLADNLEYGALVQHTSGSVVYGNNISNNSVGLSLWMDDNITVYRNIFSENAQQAMQDQCENVSWDAGYPQGGNYWSDYAGTDLFSGPDQDVPGPDGIGDTPYGIDVSGSDRYPLTGVPVIEPIPEFELLFVVPVVILACLALNAFWRIRKGKL